MNNEQGAVVVPQVKRGSWKMTWISRSDVDHSCHTKRVPRVPLEAAFPFPYVERAQWFSGGVGRGRVVVANHLPEATVMSIGSSPWISEPDSVLHSRKLTCNTGQDSRLG